MIQNLLILKRSGENIYNKCFGKVEMNQTVMSGFFSAFFVFSQQLCGQDIKSMDLGKLYKIVFEIPEGKEVIFVAICDISDSSINIRNVLNEVKDYTFINFGEEIKRNGINLDNNNKLNTYVEEILSKSQDLDIGEELLKKYNLILKELVESNNEIIDSALISSTGLTSTSNKDKEFLNLMIRQMEAFFTLTNRVLDQIILKFQNRHIILYRINEDLVLSSLTKRNVPIGITTLLVEEAVEKISKLNK